MSKYKHLPIYKITYELLEAVTRKTKNFPRDFKYSLGDKLRNECIELVVFIYKANSIKKKRNDYLEQILERLQVIELMLRLSKDLRLLSVKDFSETILMTDSLGKQAQGWITFTAESKAD